MAPAAAASAEGVSNGSAAERHSATERIDMYQYEFVQSGSVADIRDALFVAAARGVQVRVFLDQSQKAHTNDSIMI